MAQAAPTNARRERSVSFPTERLVKGGRRLSFLQWQRSFLDLEQTVLEMPVDDLRDALITFVVGYHNERKDPDDYAAWWDAPRDEEVSR